MTDRTRRGRGDATLHKRAANMDTNTEGEDVTLTEFLLERIAEDEEAAKAVHRGLWNSRNALLPPDLYGHVSRQHPARALAECEAKRRVMEEHFATTVGFCDADDWGMPCPTLKAIALPYANHPDYLQEWKP